MTKPRDTREKRKERGWARMGATNKTIEKRKPQKKREGNRREGN